MPRADGAGGRPLAPGIYLVATPIGNASDITLRALDVLRRADILAAEDTRQTRKLMEIHGIPLAGRPMIPYHDRNGAEQRPRIQRWLAEGKSLAYCSDAGTPLIADPGYRLSELAIDRDHPVTAIPGASAVLTALQLSGLPSDRFLFNGFLPPKSAARRRELTELADIPSTLVFYESPRRLPETLADMAATLGSERRAAVSRELTKRFEETRRGSLGDLAEAFAEPARGEIVIVIAPPDPKNVSIEDAAISEALAQALTEQSVKDAARDIATRFGLPRKEVYAKALELSGK